MLGAIGVSWAGDITGKWRKYYSTSNNDNKRADQRVDRRVGWGFVPLSFRMRGRGVGGGTLKGDRAEGGKGEYRQKGAAERNR